MSHTEQIWKDYHSELHGFVRGRVGDASIADDNGHFMSSLKFTQCAWIIRITVLLRHVVVIALASAILSSSLNTADAFTRTERNAFQESIKDRRGHLNPKFKKKIRNNTHYIIVHTSEGGLTSTLCTVSHGKKVRGGRRTYGGHAHYVIARDGRTYRILDKRYEADHAGLSMWNGQTRISRISIGIELVGYHYTRITDKQYHSVGLLIEILQRIYGLDGGAVLTHSQVAYGKPNYWFKKPHRGRKRCAKNFDRHKAGLAPTWHFDPDVKAGRLVADTELASIYYASRATSTKSIRTNVITSKNTAWNIAGEEYDFPTTLYRLPNGKIVRGDEIDKRIGWKRIPENTVVLLNPGKNVHADGNRGPVKNISSGCTAWDIAGLSYNKATTFYFFPHGRIKHGKEISDWDELPTKTRMIIGYRGPYRVTCNRPAITIAGTNYNKKETLYYFPNKNIITGDSVIDFKRLPRNVLIFLRTKG